jgi:hypothetical protein
MLVGREVPGEVRPKMTASMMVPSVPLNLAVVSLAMMAAAGFIYYGVPAVFGIKEEGRAILMFGAVLIAGVVAWGFLMVSALVVWGSIQNLQLGVLAG